MGKGRSVTLLTKRVKQAAPGDAQPAPDAPAQYLTLPGMPRK
jgi:hypothetical protein